MRENSIGVQPNKYRGDLADRLQGYRVQPEAAEEAEAEAEALELIGES